MAKNVRLTTKQIIFCGIFTGLVTVGAYLRVPVPYVPFTMQLFFTTLAGLLLGPRLGAISVSAYVILGLAGVPVFTQGGGPGYVLQPTFGYLIGFIIGTYVTGKIAHLRPEMTYKRLLVACFSGLAIVYSLGAGYLWLIKTFYVGDGIGAWTLFLYCFLLIIPGDAALCIISAIVGKRIIPVFRREFLGE